MVAFDDAAVSLLIVRAVVAFVVAGPTFVVLFAMLTTLGKTVVVLSAHGHNRSPAPVQAVVHLEHEPNTGEHDDFV